MSRFASRTPMGICRTIPRGWLFRNCPDRAYDGLAPRRAFRPFDANPGAPDGSLWLVSPFWMVETPRPAGGPSWSEIDEYRQAATVSPLQGSDWDDANHPGLAPWADLFHRFAVEAVSVPSYRCPDCGVGRQATSAGKGPDRRALGVSPGKERKLEKSPGGRHRWENALSPWGDTEPTPRPEGESC